MDTNIDGYSVAGTISHHKNNKQVLDKLQVERERGITVKAQTASLVWEYEGQDYLLNLIDTPVSLIFEINFIYNLVSVHIVE